MHFWKKENQILMLISASLLDHFLQERSKMASKKLRKSISQALKKDLGLGSY